MRRGDVADGGGNQTRRRSSSTPRAATTARRPGRRRSTPASPTSSARSTSPATHGCSGLRPTSAPTSSFRCRGPEAGGVRSLSIKPKRFRARSSGGPVGSGDPQEQAAGRRRGHLRDERRGDRRIQRRPEGEGARGRGSSCKSRPAPTRAQEVRVLHAREGGLHPAWAAGSNHFVFSGRIGGRKLKPGSYKLIALRRRASISEAFTVVGVAQNSCVRARRWRSTARSSSCSQRSG